MKGGRQDVALLDAHRLAVALAEHRHPGAHPADGRGADEDHLHRPLFQDGAAAADGAGKLAPVGVALDADVDQPQARLAGTGDFLRQQDGPGAGAEQRLALGRQPPQSFEEAVFLEELQGRGALAARQNQPVDALQVLSPADVAPFDAQPVQHPGVRFIITLQSQDSYLHRTFDSPGRSLGAQCQDSLLSSRVLLPPCHHEPRNFGAKDVS